MLQADIIIVGAGIAGASIARELSESASVVLLERESQVGYHSTGRSAAAYIPSYEWGNSALRLLTACSYPLFEEPPQPAPVGAGLSDDADGLAFVDRKIDSVDGRGHPGFGIEHRA